MATRGAEGKAERYWRQETVRPQKKQRADPGGTANISPGLTRTMERV
jgi:hypothetical protein